MLRTYGNIPTLRLSPYYRKLVALRRYGNTTSRQLFPCHRKPATMRCYGNTMSRQLSPNRRKHIRFRRSGNIPPHPLSPNRRKRSQASHRNQVRQPHNMPLESLRFEHHLRTTNESQAWTGGVPAHRHSHKHSHKQSTGIANKYRTVHQRTQTPTNPRPIRKSASKQLSHLDAPVGLIRITSIRPSS